MSTMYSLYYVYTQNGIKINISNLSIGKIQIKPKDTNKIKPIIWMIWKLYKFTICYFVVNLLKKIS